jgi:hypothetical protein
MANELLDFVMSVVRDPDAAANFAANPDQAILDANLTDVTSADVNALIPVVSESLSTAIPTIGLDGGVGDMAGNVWASGAATSAFDAFDDHLPPEAIDDVHSVTTELVNDPDVGLQSGMDALTDVGVPSVAGVDDPSLQFDGPVIDEERADDTPAVDDWSDSTPEDHPLDADGSGFDIFE